MSQPASVTTPTARVQVPADSGTEIKAKKQGETQKKIVAEAAVTLRAPTKADVEALARMIAAPSGLVDETRLMNEEEVKRNFRLEACSANSLLSVVGREYDLLIDSHQTLLIEKARHRNNINRGASRDEEREPGFIKRKKESGSSDLNTWREFKVKEINEKINVLEAKLAELEKNPEKGKAVQVIQKMTEIMAKHIASEHKVEGRVRFSHIKESLADFDLCEVLNEIQSGSQVHLPTPDEINAILKKAETAETAGDIKQAHKLLAQYLELALTMGQPTEQKYFDKKDSLAKKIKAAAIGEPAINPDPRSLEEIGKEYDQLLAKQDEVLEKWRIDQENLRQKEALVASYEKMLQTPDSKNYRVFKVGLRKQIKDLNKVIAGLKAMAQESEKQVFDSPEGKRRMELYSNNVDLKEILDTGLKAYGLRNEKLTYKKSQELITAQRERLIAEVERFKVLNKALGIKEDKIPFDMEAFYRVGDKEIRAFLQRIHGEPNQVEFPGWEKVWANIMLPTYRMMDEIENLAKGLDNLGIVEYQENVDKIRGIFESLKSHYLEKGLRGYHQYIRESDPKLSEKFIAVQDHVANRYSEIKALVDSIESVQNAEGVQKLLDASIQDELYKIGAKKDKGLVVIARHTFLIQERIEAVQKQIKDFDAGKIPNNESRAQMREGIDSELLTLRSAEQALRKEIMDLPGEVPAGTIKFLLSKSDAFLATINEMGVQVVGSEIKKKSGEFERNSKFKEKLGFAANSINNLNQEELLEALKDLDRELHRPVMSMILDVPALIDNLKSLASEIADEKEAQAISKDRVVPTQHWQDQVKALSQKIDDLMTMDTFDKIPDENKIKLRLGMAQIALKQFLGKYCAQPLAQLRQ